MTEQEFRNDIQKSLDLLTDILDEKPSGYRAPNFSITDSAIQTLSEAGFKYDSSYFPSVLHDRYGKIKMNQERSIAELTQLTEVPMSVNPLFEFNLPWAGGGYFRILPYPVFRAGVKSANKKNGYYCFYLHSWEVDPGQPRVSGLSASSRFRHYYGLESTRQKLRRLLGDFNFQPIESIF